MIPVMTAAMPIKMPPTLVASPETVARWIDAESEMAEAEAREAAPKAAASSFFMLFFLVSVIETVSVTRQTPS